MKAVFYEAHGGPEVLKVGDLPVPEPGEGEVLVQVSATAINPIDRRLRSGELQEYISRTFPVVPGWDFSGRIVKLGPGVSNWQVGDDVVGLAFTWSIQHGTYAEFAPVSADSIAAKPPGLSFDEAAALPLVSLTAWQALAEFGALQPGQTVLIQAGAGGIGSVAIPIAKHLGAMVYATTSTRNIDYVRGLGADHVIDYAKSDYVNVINEKEPGGLDMVLESLLSDATTEAAIRLVKPGGTVAYMNNEPPDMPEIQARNIKTEFLHHRPDGESLGQLMSLYIDGTIPIPHLDIMQLDQAQEAHRKSEGGRTQGKVVLHIQDL
ncbi:MAG: NADP-dependent oxidoreductase [Halieaceae bacterium]|jgi:NADPH:quinone reductase-like Zn-dependent oxidoreductase|nr:NADP-dependent oxidoreductase [Halieaceae bacterium]